MSITYPELSGTNFPNSIDNPSRMSDLDLTDITLVAQYYALFNAGNLSAAKQFLLDNPQLEPKIFNAVKINKLTDGIIAIQRYLYDFGGISGSGFSMRGLWSNVVNYSIGDIVSHENSIWQAIAPSIDSEPSLSNGDWLAVIYMSELYNILDGATPLPTPDVIVSRDANGNFQSASPLANGDVATKMYVDAITPLTLGRGLASCATAAGTVGKTVTLTGFSFESGAILGVTFTSVNTAASPTLNVNGTGAKAILDSVTGVAVTKDKMAGRTHFFQHNGTSWILLNPTEWKYVTGTFTAASTGEITLGFAPTALMSQVWNGDGVNTGGQSVVFGELVIGVEQIQKQHGGSGYYVAVTATATGFTYRLAGAIIGTVRYIAFV